MKKLEAFVRSVQKDGLLWGASKLVPVGFGIKKLQITAVIEDAKVGHTRVPLFTPTPSPFLPFAKCARAHLPAHRPIPPFPPSRRCRPLTASLRTTW